MMVNRAPDWFKQAARDLEQAGDSLLKQRFEWTCFAAHQAAQKAVKALHLHLGQEARGHVVAKLLRDLPREITVSDVLIDKARVLDGYYIPARYPNGHPEGAPFDISVRCRVRRHWPMPVRLLHLSTLQWPDASRVDKAVRHWAAAQGASRDAVERVGYFGSYARGDWGVGSDLDLLVIVSHTELPFEKRGLEYDTLDLPVPVDLLVYKKSEWDSMQGVKGGLPETLRKETIWVYP